jgi:hypothetical protein
VCAFTQGNAAIIVGNYKLTVGMTGPPWNYMPQNDGNVTADAAWSSAAEGQGQGMGTARAPTASLPPMWPLQNTTMALYDLAADPYETTDIAGVQPEVVKQLLARLDVRAGGCAGGVLGACS